MKPETYNYYLSHMISTHAVLSSLSRSAVFFILLDGRSCPSINKGEITIIINFEWLFGVVWNYSYFYNLLVSRLYHATYSD